MKKFLLYTTSLWRWSSFHRNKAKNSIWLRLQFPVWWSFLVAVARVVVFLSGSCRRWQLL